MKKKMKVYDQSGGAFFQQSPRRSKSISGGRIADKPSWLLLAVADMDEKMKMVVTTEEDDKADTFAKRAEAYYQKRPQLLALLQDLYSRYLALANRYTQTLPKQNSWHEQTYSTMPLSLSLTTHGDSDDIDSSSDADSSISYRISQQSRHCEEYPDSMRLGIRLGYSHNSHDDTVADKITVEVVMRNVEYGILVDVHEVQVESSTRRIELQRSLMEVLESERVILLNENAKLGFQVRALVEENKELGRECLFMKRKAGEMARCMLKMREEDHRVCMMSRRIEHLQGQIHGLEERNKEYYEKLVKQEGFKRLVLKKEGSPYVSTTLEDCLEVDHELEGGGGGGGGGGKRNLKGGKGNFITRVGPSEKGKMKVSKLWGRLKSFDMFMCGPSFNGTC